MSGYRYPDTHAERAAWLLSGTPAPWQPYTPEAPDPTRDGLLRGFLDHYPTQRKDKP